MLIALPPHQCMRKVVVMMLVNTPLCDCWRESTPLPHYTCTWNVQMVLYYHVKRSKKVNHTGYRFWNEVKTLLITPAMFSMQELSMSSTASNESWWLQYLSQRYATWPVAVLRLMDLSWSSPESPLVVDVDNSPAFPERPGTMAETSTLVPEGPGGQACANTWPIRGIHKAYLLWPVLQKSVCCCFIVIWPPAEIDWTLSCQSGGK